MIQIVVASETLKVTIPKEVRAEAHLHLKEIWRDEFTGSSNLVVELTEPVRDFVEKVKLDRHNILVYR